ncbi:Arf-GAP with Rho-GAP domain, ANK repeat and PH domain-containing protein 1 isoform X2 [Aix galericulata]|nr:Arf-GAP with Rho-GAP domain, ANK repeat and PH domain-containing protein 1 isoform X2 [Aix galericulata]
MGVPAKEEIPVPVPIPDREPPVPPSPPALLPRAKPQPAPQPQPPSEPSCPFVPEFDDSDYEDPAWEEELASPAGQMADKEDAEAVTGRPRSLRFNSLFSEDELIEDYYDAPPANAGRGWSDDGPSPSALGDLMERSAAPQLSPTIRAGWLDKNPPQGSYIYQKRWVKLDAEYLRYFDSEKDAYSKRLIPVSSISRVASVGDQKFEVVTTNRNFVFRAESDADRKEWMQTLQQVAEERKGKAPERTPVPPPAPDATEPADKSGFLELRGFKHKLFVAVAGDKVFLYKNSEDYRQGIGITYIEMNVGNVKEEKEEWVEAMRHAIAEALSNSEVAERIWALEPNRFCADCGSPQPDWASINLCVVICKRCAGEHRGLGPGITKVRSLKMDRKVWTEELIQLFHHIGNAVANQFWAANVPPSEAIGPGSSSQDRRRFLIAKYREGKYRRYHPLFGNQEELDRALCAAVTTSDLAETQALVFCGAAVTCATGDPQCPVPLALAEKSGQRLQMEFLLHNKTSETPRLEVGGGEEKHYSVLLPCVTHNGFLYKTPSMAKPVSERKGQEEFSRRWCTLQDGVLSYYENDRNAVPNGEIKAGDIVCLVNNPPHTHGIESTFEVYIESERLYLFGLDCPEAAREWLKSIAKSFVPPHAEELLSHDFERIGRLLYKGGLNLERAKEGWFALAGSTLYVCFEGSERHEALQLRKLQELCRCPVPPPVGLEGGPGGGTDPAPSSRVAAVGLSSRVLMVGVWQVPLPRPGCSGTLLWAGRFPRQLLPPRHPLPRCCSPSLGWSWAAPEGLLPSLRSHPGRQRGAGAGGEAEVSTELGPPPAKKHPLPKPTLLLGRLHPRGEPGLGSGTVPVGLGRGRPGPPLSSAAAGRTLYIQGERRLDFLGWVHAIQKAAGSSGDTLSEQQLTEGDVPMLVDRCIDYITQCGTRPGGTGSLWVTPSVFLPPRASPPASWEAGAGLGSCPQLLGGRGAPAGWGAPRPFLGDPLMSKPAWVGGGQTAALPGAHRWWWLCCAPGLTSEGIYRKSGQNSKTTSLLEVLRRDARSVRLKEGEHHVDDVANTLKRFFRDLGDGLFTRRWSQDWLRATALEDEEAKIGEYRRLLDTLPTVNRATLKALINHLFRVQRFSGDNQMNTHNLAIVFGPTLFQTDGKDYKAGRVVEDLISHYVKIFNVNEQEMKKQQDEITAIMKMREAASSGTQQAGDFICTVYLEEKRTETEQHVKIPATMTAEELTFEILDRRKIVTKEKDYWSCFEVNEREEAGRCGGGDGSHKPEKEWPVRNLRVYLGIKKKLRPPTWGFTVFYENEKHEKQQWYLCCDTQADLREWFATFLHVQHGGALWPSETCKVRASRRQQDARLAPPKRLSWRPDTAGSAASGEALGEPAPRR